MIHQTIAKGLRVKLMLVAFLVAFALAGPTLVPASASAEGRFGSELDCEGTASHRTIQEGNTGKSVKHAQCLLNEWGYNLDVDGDFSPKTDAAVRDFQRSNGLSDDGIVGKRTWDELHPDGGFPVKPPAP